MAARRPIRGRLTRVQKKKSVAVTPTWGFRIRVLLFKLQRDINQPGTRMTKHLGEFEQLLLFALVRLGDGAYGVALRRDIEDRTGRSISAGAVYTALDRLETRGYVASRLGEPTPMRGGRRKKHYELLPAGAESLHRSYRLMRQMTAGIDAKLAGLLARQDSASGE